MKIWVSTFTKTKTLFSLRRRKHMHMVARSSLSMSEYETHLEWILGPGHGGVEGLFDHPSKGFQMTMAPWESKPCLEVLTMAHMVTRHGEHHIPIFPG